MRKRILVPMDDSALAKALVSCAQSPSIVSCIVNAWEAETRTYLTRAEYEGKPISFLIRKSSIAETIPAVADAMKSIRLERPPLVVQAYRAGMRSSAA